MTLDWQERSERAIARHDDGLARLPGGLDERQRQLTRTGNAAWAAGMSFLMLGRTGEARSWLLRAAERYRESWPGAPPGSWGRPIGAMKARLVAGDVEGAREDARWALEAGAPGAESPIGRYAAALAHLVLGDDAEARGLATPLLGEDAIPPPVAEALVALADRDRSAYACAVESLIADFEGRVEFLEDVPVADTVLALQALAAARGIAAEVSSPLLPDGGSGLAGGELA